MMSSTKENKDIIVKTPSETDVLCGRGAPINRHSGNIIFRKVVKCNKELYNVCTKKERYYVAESIVQALENQSPPTRFLEAYGGGDETWVAISKERAIRKTVQALREKNPAKEENQTHDLRGMLSRENSKKKGLYDDSDFDQEDMDNWNNLMNYLIPPSASVCEDENISSPKRQKTSHRSSPSSSETQPCYIDPPARVTPDRISSSRRVSCIFSEVGKPEEADLSVEQLINDVEFEETPLAESASQTPVEEIPLAGPQSNVISPSISDVTIEDDWATTKIDFDQYMAQEDFGEELDKNDDNDRFKISKQSPVLQDLNFEEETQQPDCTQCHDTPYLTIGDRKNNDDWLDGGHDDLVIDDRVLDGKWFGSSDTKDNSVESQVGENDDWVFESPTLVEW